MRLDVLLGLVLRVRDFSDFLSQFLNQAEGVSFGVGISGAEGIADIVLIVSNEPYAIGSSQFIAFACFGFECLDFGGHLGRRRDTRSRSALSSLLEVSLVMVLMGMEEEYLA